MRSILNKLLPLLIVTLVSGCASTSPMPFAEPDVKPEASQPLYLMTVVVKNTYKERWQPRILNVRLTKDAEADKTEELVFLMDQKGTIKAADRKSSAFLVRLRGGDSFNMITGMVASASAFPVIGFFFVPLYAQLESDAPGIYYLGAVQASIRERKDNEFRAGPVIPLIDQAIAGASTGTFDITIADLYDQDVALFRATFPALENATIIKKVLPQWDRTRAQTEWEKN
jgi:hypothetical protein